MATLSMTPMSHISADNDVVVSEIFITAPRERVFRALTDPAQVVHWWGAKDRYLMGDVQMDLRVGGKWSARGMSAKMGNTEVHGEYTEVDPPRRLAYTWSATWMPEVTNVLWELETHDGGTMVKLTHSGFAGQAEQAKNHSLGWTSGLGWLQGFLERGETVASRD